VSLRKIISARKNELEQATKSSGGGGAGTQPTPLSRVQRVQTRCSSAGAAVSGASLVAEIAALPDESDDTKVAVAVDAAADDADSELAAV